MTADALAAGQGAYFAATGVWPLLHYRSFEAVTGPKTDDWLVKTVGTLIAVIGTTLLVAGARRRTAPALGLLGAGSAAGLAAVDLVYATRGRISRVYLADALVESGLVAAWLLARRRRA